MFNSLASDAGDTPISEKGDHEDDDFETDRLSAQTRVHTDLRSDTFGQSVVFFLLHFMLTDLVLVRDRNFGRLHCTQLFFLLHRVTIHSGQAYCTLYSVSSDML